MTNVFSESAHLELVLGVDWPAHDENRLDRHTSPADKVDGRASRLDARLAVSFQSVEHGPLQDSLLADLQNIRRNGATVEVASEQ
jgi:hypothetical protein